MNSQDIVNGALGNFPAVLFIVIVVVIILVAITERNK